MPGKAAKVVITERQQEILQRWVRSRSCPRGLAQRAEIILLAFDRLQNGPIAEQLGCERHAVGIWRRRWADAFDTLVRIECLEGLSALEAAIEDVLSDNPRSGCHAGKAPHRITQQSYKLYLCCNDHECDLRKQAFEFLSGYGLELISLGHDGFGGYVDLV